LAQMRSFGFILSTTHQILDRVLSQLRLQSKLRNPVRCRATSRRLKNRWNKREQWL
jgi:hypothetical protein